ncbi:MAG: hypothetical protein V1820_00155 [archaeon]
MSINASIYVSFSYPTIPGECAGRTVNRANLSATEFSDPSTGARIVFNGISSNLSLANYTGINGEVSETGSVSEKSKIRLAQIYIYTFDHYKISETNMGASFCIRSVVPIVSITGASCSAQLSGTCAINGSVVSIDGTMNYSSSGVPGAYANLSIENWGPGYADWFAIQNSVSTESPAQASTQKILSSIYPYFRLFGYVSTASGQINNCSAVKEIECKNVTTATTTTPSVARYVIDSIWNESDSLFFTVRNSGETISYSDFKRTTIHLDNQPLPLSSYLPSYSPGIPDYYIPGYSCYYNRSALDSFEGGFPANAVARIVCLRKYPAPRDGSYAKVSVKVAPLNGAFDIRTYQYVPPTPVQEPSCSCSDFSNVSCGSNGCPGGFMYQVRTCTPFACASTRTCTAYHSCFCENKTVYNLSLDNPVAFHPLGAGVILKGVSAGAKKAYYTGTNFGYNESAIFEESIQKTFAQMTIYSFNHYRRTDTDMGASFCFVSVTPIASATTKPATSSISTTTAPIQPASNNTTVAPQTNFSSENYTNSTADNSTAKEDNRNLEIPPEIVGNEKAENETVEAVAEPVNHTAGLEGNASSENGASNSPDSDLIDKGKATEEAVPCFDSDGGLESFSKGHVSGLVSPRENAVVRSDWCVQAPSGGKAIAVQACAGTGCGVREWRCVSDVFIGSFDIPCENGCRYGACIVSSREAGAGGETANPKAGKDCENGCNISNYCVMPGGRKSGHYCDFSYNPLPQIEEGYCENGFECKSNLCIDSKCTKRSLFRSFLAWLGLFRD